MVSPTTCDHSNDSCSSSVNFRTVPMLVLNAIPLSPFPKYFTGYADVSFFISDRILSSLSGSGVSSPKSCLRSNSQSYSF